MVESAAKIKEQYMTIDISLVPIEYTLFSWLSKVCEANNPKYLLISELQQRTIFGSGDGRWTHYRGVELKIKEQS